MNADYTKSIKWGFNLLFIIFGAFLILITFYLSKDIERTYFPVVTNFEIQNIIGSDQGFEVSGILEKSRECEFISMIAYADKAKDDEIKSPLIIDFKDVDKKSTRAPIKQTWGPWYMTIPYEYNEVEIDFYIHHRCHNFYMTSSKLVTFSVFENDDKYSIEQK